MAQWAAVFPGQGSQAVGMGRDLWEAGGTGQEMIDRANAALDGRLLPAMLEGPEDLLRRTELTQPALFVVSAALWQRFTTRGTALPGWVAGHSLGEYSALYAAGVFDFETALKLVVQRGNLMQQAAEAGTGGMAAIIGMEDAAVEATVAAVGNGLVVANYNSPGQVVVSGPKETIEAAATAFKAAGAKRYLPLPVAGAFHSPAVADANLAMKAALETAPFAKPHIPIVMNVDGSLVTTAAEARVRLAEQMISSVRWTQSVRTLAAAGCQRLVEMGSGKVLSGLAKRIVADLDAVSVATPDEVDALEL